MVGLSDTTFRSVARGPLPPLGYGRLSQVAETLGDPALLRPERTLTTYLMGEDGEPVSAQAVFYRLRQTPFQGSLHFAAATDLGELSLRAVTQAWVGALLGNSQQMAVGILEAPAARVDPLGARRWLDRWSEHFAVVGAGEWRLADYGPEPTWLSPLVSLALAERQLSLAGARVAVAGPGCQEMALGLHRAGARVVAVGDGLGGAYSEPGLPESDLAGLGRQMSWSSVRHGAVIRGDEVASLPCDVLVWADPQRPLGRAQATQLQAPIVVEALPGAIAAEADSLLQTHGRFVIPDLLSLAAAHAAGTENGALWLMAAYDDVRRLAERRSLDRRTAAYSLAAGRAASGHGRRGTQPLE